MDWHTLNDLDHDDDEGIGHVPKLSNLCTAHDSGLDVPPTVWGAADSALTASIENDFGLFAAHGITIPCIVRSGSPTEDSATTSNAGQFLSLKVERSEDLADAIRQVAGSLPNVNGKIQGAVFLQPWINAQNAGVTFFDGFYFEESSAEGSNVELTAGLARGQVRRGHLERGSAHSEWLDKIGQAFRGNIDIEWAEPVMGKRILLQVRPALFPLIRDETLSLANHKEILGDPPSPWMVGILAEVAHEVMTYYEGIESRVKGWNEPYAFELGGRAWMNFSAFYRLMDLWGLPRSMVPEGVGGTSTNPADKKLIWRRFFASVPVLCRLQIHNLITLTRISRRFVELEAEIENAVTLPDLQQLNARALAFAIRSNFAINGSLMGVSKVRKFFGIKPAAQLITQKMMSEYAHLSSLPTEEERARGLDAWLERFGHRGPLESDLYQPRFLELRQQLLTSLLPLPVGSGHVEEQKPSRFAWLFRPLFWLDEFRESFRDRLMKLWLPMRIKVLKLAKTAPLDDPSDVFFLRSEQLAADPAGWRGTAEAQKATWKQNAELELPSTAPKSAIEEAIMARSGSSSRTGSGEYKGIGLGRRVVEGVVVKGSSLTEVLARHDWPERPVLLVAALEPSWAVVFSRFVAVVSELGGEMSHASILLREAGIPAVINAEGAFRGINDGQRVEIDTAKHMIKVIE